MRAPPGTLFERVMFTILALISLVALVGPALAPADPLLRVAAPYLGPSAAHLFGTDDVGRDLLSRVIGGVQITWLLSLLVIAISLAIGCAVGALGALSPAWLDQSLARLTDLFMVIPSTLIALAAVATIGPGTLHTVGVLAVFWWPWYARIVRAELRAVAARPHVDAARVAGASGLTLLARHMFPAALPTLMVTATLDVANVILVLSFFSFLGLGAPAPTPELGAMTARTLIDLTTHPWIPLIPATAIFVLVLASNLAGDALRGALEGL
jgi:peptide/nickel transport system permease protein